MGQLDLTVLVLNLSPKVTVSELNSFFSYCGTVEKIQLNLINNNQQQAALVTFRQPYASRTALLLNDAALAGQPVRILRTQDTTISHISFPHNETEKQKFIPSEVQSMASKRVEVQNKTKDEAGENHKLSEKGKALVERTRSAVSVVAQTATEHIGNAIRSNEFISSGTLWFSGLLDKASKSVAYMGNDKRNNPNSRKQK